MSCDLAAHGGSESVVFESVQPRILQGKHTQNLLVTSRFSQHECFVFHFGHQCFSYKYCLSAHQVSHFWSLLTHASSKHQLHTASHTIKQLHRPTSLLLSIMHSISSTDFFSGPHPLRNFGLPDSALVPVRRLSNVSEVHNLPATKKHVIRDFFSGPHPLRNFGLPASATRQHV